ncbi:MULTISPECIES: amino acid ABC transporter substrate-binding protein [Streptococcus]|uniref:amino acid ABC transporter substrate-binding protein n=1 Tax=Streptococcus TaxID=1301 RepID=UPI001C8293DF|nr:MULTISPECIES: amino acid ABC transporter substrate-binding protein [Streptococcus]MBX5325158.1 amino acid ABC transporter substrate-binding protein [Streptococcus cristatus]MDB6209570.1 amino acid ABC transporter substrate-binding protein [Streptococcus oralis]
MKRKKITLVLALFFSFFLTACTQKVSDPNQDNWAKYQKQGSITIGFDNTFVPMGFEEKNGQYAGFDIDLAQAVSEKLGIQIKFQPIDWDMKETELQNGTIDAIWNGYTATDERKEKVAFTIPYMENQQVLVSKKSQNIHSIQDMTDKVLGAQAGSSGYLNFEGQPERLKNRVKDQKANQYQSFNEALIDLKNDRIDALLIDRVYANYYLQSEGILNDYNIFSAGFESEAFAVGVRPADKTLLAALNQAFISLYQEGKFQEISQKWFGEDVATSQVKNQE